MGYTSKYKGAEIDALLEQGVLILSSENKLETLGLPKGSVVSIVNGMVDFEKLYQPTIEDFNSEGAFYIKNPSKFSSIKNLKNLKIDQELLKLKLNSLSLNTGASMFFYDISSPIEHKVSLAVLLARVMEGGTEMAVCQIQCTDDNYLGGGDYGESTEMIATKQGDTWVFNTDITNVMERLTRQDYEFVYGGCVDPLTGEQNNALSIYFDWLQFPSDSNAVINLNNGWEALALENAMENLPSMSVLNRSMPDSPFVVGANDTKGYQIFPNKRYVINRLYDSTCGKADISLIRSGANEDVFIVELRGVLNVTFPSNLLWKDGKTLSALDATKVYVVTIKNGLASYEEFYAFIE